MTDLEFAPVSNAESVRLRFASGYFLLNGIAIAVLGLKLAVGLLRHGSLASQPVGILIFGAVFVTAGALSFWIAKLLNEHRRLGGILAVTLFGIDLLGFIAVGDRPFIGIALALGGFFVNSAAADSGFSGLSAVVGLILIYSIRNELHKKPS